MGSRDGVASSAIETLRLRRRAAGFTPLILERFSALYSSAGSRLNGSAHRVCAATGLGELRRGLAGSVAGEEILVSVRETPGRH